MLAEFGFLGFERDIFRAEQLDLHLGAAIEHVETVARQFWARGVREVELRELELKRLDLRIDLLDEMQVGVLSVGAVGVAGHGDVAARQFLVERGREFAPIEQPLVEIVG